MGQYSLDAWSLGHFIMGMLSCLLLNEINLHPFFNFILSNGIHLFIELNEKSVLNGKVVESLSNHVGDSVLFFLGWLSVFYDRDKIYITSSSIPYLWVILVFTLFKEIFQEKSINYKNASNEIRFSLIVITSLILFVLNI
jgi:hypothetical protein